MLAGQGEGPQQEEMTGDMDGEMTWVWGKNRVLERGIESSRKGKHWGIKKTYTLSPGTRVCRLWESGSILRGQLMIS